MPRKTAHVRKISKTRNAAPLLAKKTNTAPVSSPEGLDSNKPDTSQQDARWLEDILILRRAAEEIVARRRRSTPALILGDRKFREIADALDDPSSEIRQSAVRRLYELDPDGAATFVNNALRDGSQERRRNIGNALADSGLLFEAIDDLMDESHERCYGAFSLLLLVAKAGVVQPLLTVIEKHPSLELRLAVIRLLASSNDNQAVSALERISNTDSLPPEIRSATLEAISQLTRRSR
jgi:HEAT repeat protein